MNRPRILSCVFLLLAAGAAWYWYPGPVGKEPVQPTIGTGPDLERWRPLFDSTVAFPERLALARRIDSTLPLPVVAKWASTLNPQASGTKEVEHTLVVYNEIADQSRHRNLHPATLTGFLMNAVADSALHPVLRDYAAQHLALWVSGNENGQPGEPEAHLRGESLILLCRTAGDPSVRETSLPGTVLLALADVASRQPEALAEHWLDLDRALAGLIANRDTPRPLRLSAIQIAASAGRSLHLPAIRQLVAAARQDEAVLIASVAALGRLGNRDDRALLDPLIQAGGITGHAATASLARLQP